jgi:hypothetical protein
MKYMLLIYGDPSAGPAQGTPEAEAEMQRWFTYTQGLQDDGSYVAGDALLPIDQATTVRVRDGQDFVTDGPVAETKEWLGGYYVVDVPDLDAALDRAKKMPNIAHGTVEVRPLMVFDQP